MNTSNYFRGEFKIKLGKTNYKGVFNMNALRLVLRDEKMQLEDFEGFISNDALTAIPTIAYFSIINECVKSGKELKMNKDKFIAEFYESEGALEEVTEAITNAMSAGDEGKA